MNINTENALNKVLEYPLWRQCISLDENGLMTQGYLPLDNEWELLNLPQSLKNLSFLDVGSNDGYFSFQAEKKQAKRVVALDVYKEMKFLSMTSGWSIEGIRIAKEYMNSLVEIVPGSIYTLDKLNEKFDITFCNNVVSWIRDTPLAINQLCNVTNKTLYIQDQFDTSAKYNILGENYDINVLSLSNIKNELIKNGWGNLKIIKINENKRNRKQFQLAKSNGLINVYLSPKKETVLKQINFNDNKLILSEMNDKCYIKQIGWVNKIDVTIYNQPNGFKKTIKKLLGKNTIDFIKNIGNKKITKDILIIATKN